MAGWDVAVTAMASVCAAGFLAADGERRRVCWVRAMRRSLLRIADLIRYEQPDLRTLLLRVDLRATPQERELTRLLHACASRMEQGKDANLARLFEEERASAPACGALGEKDTGPYEAVLSELGLRGMSEQLRLIGEADERLRCREEELRRDGDRRAQLIRALSLTGGAAVFLMLV